MRGWTLARRSAAALLIMGAASACRNVNAPVTPCSVPLTGMTIQMRSGEPTLFSWTPECTVSGVFVETSGTTAPGADLWIVHDPKSRIKAPVSYGVTPTNASEVLAPVPMVTGQRYRVHLIGVQGQELYSTDFTQ
jgi:hypothetical protein